MSDLIEPSLLNDQAYRALKGALVSGMMRAGEMVSLQDLVKRFHMPLAPIREAVKRAASEKFLRIVPKRGIYVMEATPERLLECFGLRMLIDREGARKLARRVRAGLAQPALDALQTAHQALYERALVEVDQVLAAEAYVLDWQLHLTLSGAIHNPLIEEIYAINREKIRLMQNTRPSLPDRVAPSLAEHLDILRTIASGDPEAADQKVCDHYRQTLRWWGILNPTFD